MTVAIDWDVAAPVLALAVLLLVGLVVGRPRRR
jgi:MYXO-CTERM domain-containing protein